MKRLCQLISDYMGVIILLVAILSYLFPSALVHVSPTIINYLLSIVMFGMGLTLRFEDFRIVFSRPKDVIIGELAQFIIMPLIAWSLTRIFRLDDSLTLGVILVGCCPGGTASNVITYLSNGDLALSVGITGVSTIVAPFLTPLLTWFLAGERIHVDVLSMFLSILWVVIVPIIFGFAFKRFFPKASERAVTYLPALSVVSIACIVAIIISANAAKLMLGGACIIAVVVLHNLLGLLLGYLTATLFRLQLPKRKALAIEVGMQNSGLASSLATLHFAAYPMATIPGAIFSVWHNLSGAIVARFFSRHSL